MPIPIKDFTWKQSDDRIIIRVPIRSGCLKDVDLFTTDVYIKLHCPPFIFEAFLFDEVIEGESKCVLSKAEVVLELIKKRFGQEWDSLEKPGMTRDEMTIVRQNALVREHKKNKQISEQRKKEINKRQQECVKQQLTLEKKVRDEISGKKQIEKQEAVKDITTWKRNETDDDKALLPLWKQMEGRMSTKTPATIPRPTPPLAPLRSFGRITCEFTQRAFPTPLRESKVAEEEEWLRKQAEARRQIGFLAENLRPEENNPEWLLEKGRNFHHVGNYLGAISVFTHAIDSWSQLPEMYVERSHSHLALGNWHRVLIDTSEALELCRPHVESNSELRFYSHLNRGKALLELKQGRNAAAEFVEALELKPYYSQLEHLLDRAERFQEDEEKEMVEKHQQDGNSLEKSGAMR